ncbi:MAG: ATP-binding cassette domain-containing protein [Ruminococcus sp.]|nr:ATP-binding cassette domain-containing protein [Ruminococcus sp.]
MKALIKRIEITNFKSIESLKLCIQNEHIIGILGKNGTGKSTLFHAVNYFFSKLNKQHSDDVVIDGVNPYVQKCTITISFNLARMFMKSKGNKELSEIMNFIQEYQQEFFGKVSDVLSITMIQYRDGRIVWSIDKKYQEKILNAIKRYFPIYFINVRNLDLQSWNKLWDIIGDLLMSVPRENVEHLKKLDEAFFAIYGERYIKSKQKIEDTFKEEGISLDPFSFRSRFKDVFKLRFGGEQFEFNERNLDYYSDGTNSYKYLKLLISLIPYVSELSCKHPLIMIDEPEIGLHSAFITELVECIHHSIEDKAVLLFTTHSPKVIEELTNQGVEYALYRTSDYRLHTILTKLNLQWLKDGKHTVTIKETECYFSDYLVYVEGESEVQLFQNKYLRRLFELTPKS